MVTSETFMNERCNEQYVVLKHKVSGEVVVFKKGEVRWRRLALGFLNKIRTLPYTYFKHITLTQRVESYKPNILHPFFVKLRRYYGDLVYLWTVEEQRRGVLHWHVLVCFVDYVGFGADDVRRIQRYWKYGNVDVRTVRKASLSYLMKYMGKALSVVFEGVRRIGSSRIEGYFRQSWKNFIRAVKWFCAFGLGLKDMGDGFKWRDGDAYVELYDAGGWFLGCECFYRRPREWRLVEVG